MPMSAVTSIFLLVLQAAAAEPPPGGQAAAPAMRFEVKSLPGWIEQKSGMPADLPSPQYTGYLDAGVPPSGKGRMYFHYWMVLAEHKPETAPVIIWYNGGPGASSLFGVFQEFGPLLLDERSFDERYRQTGVPTLMFNPFRWSRTHTLVAIDSPPPMGLSFCSEFGPTGGATSCGPWTDKSVFKANHAAHKAFFTDVWPGLKHNPFFFAGESYAGMYVPGFVEAMLDDPVPNLNFQGFMVGDGFPGCEPLEGHPADWCIDLVNVGTFKYPNANAGPYYDVEFFHGHQQFSNDLYRQIMATCPEPMLKGVNATQLSPKCSVLIDKMARQVGPFSAYNLYDNCPADQPVTPPGGTTPSFHGDKHGIFQSLHDRRHVVARLAAAKRRRLDDKPNDSGLSSPCLANAMAVWFAQDVTLAAIGAPEGIRFINLDNGIGFNYTTDQAFVGPIYKKALQAGLRVLIYEGDTDACGLTTSPIQDQMFPVLEDALGPKTRDWHPWSCGSDEEIHLGGYITEWGGRGGDAKAMFVSFRGAGHMVPLNRPEASFAAANGFTHKEHFPGFNPRYSPSHSRAVLV